MGNECSQTRVSREEICEENTEDYHEEEHVSGDKVTSTEKAKRFLTEGASKDLLWDSFTKN